jgi:hypothetical protein
MEFQKQGADYCDGQQSANCGPTVTINQRLQYVRLLTFSYRQ